MTSPPDAAEIRKMFEEFASAPRKLFELCSGAPVERMRRPLSPGKWTPLEIIQHLVGCDKEALLPRIEKILAEENPFLAAHDQDAWMKRFGRVNDKTAVVLLNEWARLREKSAVLLFDLSVEGWLRTGRHEERGEITLYDLVSYFARHDEHHRAQIKLHLEPIRS